MLAQALALHSVVPQMANNVSQPQFSPFFFVPSPSKFLIDGLLDQKSLLAKVVRNSQITWVMQFEESINSLGNVAIGQALQAVVKDS